MVYNRIDDGSVLGVLGAEEQKRSLERGRQSANDNNPILIIIEW